MIAHKSMTELKNLAITKVQWCSYKLETIAFSINDGQSCKAGSREACYESHVFDPAKKITSIKTIYDAYKFCQINFYHNEERLVRIGDLNDLSRIKGRSSEIFRIGQDEQLIGCKLN